MKSAAPHLGRRDFVVCGHEPVRGDEVLCMVPRLLK